MFPKRFEGALIVKAEELGEKTQILKAVIKLNDEQPLKLIEVLKKHISPGRVCLTGGDA